MLEKSPFVTFQEDKAHIFAPCTSLACCKPHLRYLERFRAEALARLRSVEVDPNIHMQGFPI